MCTSGRTRAPESTTAEHSSSHLPGFEDGGTDKHAQGINVLVRSITGPPVQRAWAVSRLNRGNRLASNDNVPALHKRNHGLIGGAQPALVHD